MIAVVEAHYRQLFGKPDREAGFVSRAGEEIHVLKWAESRTPIGVTLYGTAGSSQWYKPGTDGSHRMEFFIGLKPEADDVATTLAELARDPLVNPRELNVGDTVTLPESLWSGTDMRSVMVMDGDDIIPPLILDNGVHVVFRKIIPLYDNELAYKRDAGSDGLLERWRSQVVPFWNPFRPPSNI
jgi:hypothetical protein